MPTRSPGNQTKPASEFELILRLFSLLVWFNGTEKGYPGPFLQRRELNYPEFVLEKNLGPSDRLLKGVYAHCNDANRGIS